jgi:hypothetical protein
MTYDSGRKRVLLFGGVDGPAVRNDTWEWDGSLWTQVADTGPSGRAHLAMVYDEARQRVVLFGGSGHSSKLGDTWEWDGVEWTQVADMGPSARSDHAMAFHGALQRVILVGGYQLSTSELGDTWQWDGVEWLQIADTGPRRLAHGLCYDAARSRLVLFGGWSGGGNAADTWEFTDLVWVKQQNMGPGPIPSPRMTQAATRTILVGGLVDGQPGTTWQWDSELWVQRQNMGPLKRIGHALAYDSARDRVVLFGGNTGSALLGDTWELSIA